MQHTGAGVWDIGRLWVYSGQPGTKRSPWTWREGWPSPDERCLDLYDKWLGNKPTCACSVDKHEIKDYWKKRFKHAGRDKRTELINLIKQMLTIIQSTEFVVFHNEFWLNLRLILTLYPINCGLFVALCVFSGAYCAITCSATAAALAVINRFRWPVSLGRRHSNDVITIFKQ